MIISFVAPTSIIVINQSNNFLMISSMSLTFLSICVTSALGCLFCLQKSISLVVSTLDTVLYCVIPLSICFLIVVL